MVVQLIMDIEAIGRELFSVQSDFSCQFAESAYQRRLTYELEQKRHEVDCELLLPIQYGRCRSMPFIA